MTTGTRLFIGFQLAIVVFGFGIAVGKFLAPDVPRPPRSSPTPSQGHVQPAAGATAGSERPTEAVERRSRHGAVEAATEYALAVDGPALLDPARQHELLADIAAEDARDDLAGALGAAGALIAERLHLTADRFHEPGFVWRPAPAGWQVRAYSRDEAVVAIWATGVVMVDGLRLPQPGWRTTETTVRWERGDWRLVSFHTEPGPAPPSPGEPPDPSAGLQIDAFESYRYLASTGR